MSAGGSLVSQPHLGQGSPEAIEEGSETAVGFSIGSVVQVAVQMGLLEIVMVVVVTTFEAAQ